MTFTQQFFGIDNIFQPNEIAIKTSFSSLKYDDLINHILTSVFYLKQIGVKQNDYIGITGDNSYQFIVTIFALWQIGAIPVLINIRLLNYEIDELLEIANCKMFLISKNLSNSFYFGEIPKIFYPFEAKENIGQTILPINLNKNAVIIFTSGSTGKPKGVEITFNNLINSAQTGNQYFVHKQNDSWIASLPFYHIGGFSIIMRSVLFGLTLIIPDNLDVKNLAQSLKSFDPSHASFVSTQLKRLIELDVKPNNSLRNVLVGGGFIDQNLVENAIKSGWKVSLSFGATETSSFVSILSQEHFRFKGGSSGKVLYPNNILILDDNKNILPPGIVGEIAIKSNSVAKGYINNIEETKKKFLNGLYYTGDFGFLDKDEYLYVQARRNDLIISGGENVNPLEIENELIKHPLILEASVFGLMDSEWGQIIAAVIVSENNTIIPLENIKLFLNNKLSSFKHPKRIFFVPELPKTELGKVRKEKLRDMFNY